MNTQPEALRLADALQQQAVWEGHYGPSYLRDLLPEAAAELRRLHALLEAEQALHQRITYPELRRLRAQRDAIQQVVDEQAEDEGLWFRAQTAAEAYLQQELRRLHAAVEGEK